MKTVLFVCGRNQLRSPTAEQVFANYEGIEAGSAGLDPGCANPVTPELVTWADIIFVMERAHRTKLSRRFRPQLGRARVICLEIADEFAFMEPALVALLEARVSPHLR